MNLIKITLSLLLLASTALTKAQPPRNIIFVFVDDLNVSGSVLGGHYQAQIPNIESLMGESVTFKNAHCNAPICGPSRASIFCGLYPHTTGMFGYTMDANKWFNNPVISTVDQIFEHFLNNGYSVYGGGKTYHGASENVSMFTDYGIGSDAGPWPWDTVLGARTGHPGMHPTLQGEHDVIASLADDPKSGPIAGWYLDGQKFNYTNDSVRDLMTDEKLIYYADSLLKLSHSQPFFITLGINRPHTPLVVPQKYFDMYPLSSIDIPGWMMDDLDDVTTSGINNAWTGRTGISKHQKMIDASTDSTDKKAWVKRYIQGYLASVTFTDDQIGALMAAVDSSIYDTNTYIVIASDHGFHLGQKDWLFKWSLWDAATKIPFIVRGPGVAQNQICNKPISLVDIYPTFVDLAGIPNPSQALDGNSIQPFLIDPVSGTWSGPDVALTSIASIEEIPVDIVANKDHQHYTVRSENYRYTLASSGEEELYDHTVDSNEYFNVADDASYAAIKSNLRSQMLAITGHSPLTPSDSNHLFYGEFEQEYNGWKNQTNGGSVATFNIDLVDFQVGSASARIDVTSHSGGNNGVQMINENVTLVNGQAYEVSFWAKSATGGSVLRAHHGRNGIPDYQFHSTNEFNLTTSWVKYTYTYTQTDSTSNLNNRMYFRLLNADSYWIDHVEMKIAPPPPPVCDPGFEGTGSDWQTLFQDGGAGTAGVQSVDVHNGAQSYEAIVTTAGANLWSNKLQSCKHSLINGHTYELKFWAKSSSNGMTIAAQDGMSSAPFTNYLNQTQALTTTWTQYSYMFVSGADINLDARIKIQLHGTGTFYFDDFELNDVTITAVTKNELTGINVYPNPVTEELHFTNTTNAELEYGIYTPEARLIQRGMSAAGTVNEVDVSNLNPGVYFIEFTDGANATIRKIVVQ